VSGKWHGGKGSKARTVDRAKWEENYHRIFGYKNADKKCVECGEVDGRHTNNCIVDTKAQLKPYSIDGNSAEFFE